MSPQTPITAPPSSGASFIATFQQGVRGHAPKVAGTAAGLVIGTAEAATIAARVDQLMALCGELERKLTIARNASATLMTATAGEVLAA